MKFTRPSGNTMIVQSQENGFAFLFLACFLGCVALDLVRYLRDSAATSTESFQGALGGAAVGLLGFLAAFERSSFAFDRGRQVLHWKRRRALRKRAGTVPFAEIEAVTIQTPIGDTGIPSRRVTLMVRGKELPLTAAYAPDHDDMRLRLAEEIRRFIGGPAEGVAEDESLMAAVRSAIKRGNHVEAVRLLRQERHLSLVEAKQLVDQLRATEGAKGRT